MENLIEIEIISNLVEKIDGMGSIWGQITLENFKEEFPIPLMYWTKEDYLKQWRKGIERIKEGKNSCLITAIQVLNINPLIEWWVFYKIGSNIIIRNQLIFGSIYNKLIGNSDFNLNNCYDFIPLYKAYKGKDKPTEIIINFQQFLDTNK